MYVCSICDQAFASSDSLGNHLTFFHNCLFRGNFFCVFCVKSLSSLHTFKKHLQSSHPNHNDDYMRYRAQVNAIGHVHDVVQNGPDVAGGGVEVEFAGDGILGDGVAEDGIAGDGLEGEVEGENDIFSLHYFIKELYTNIESFVAQLYAIPSLNRKCVETMLTGTSELISNFSLTLKKNVFKFLSTFENVPENYADELTKLENMFSVLLDPFESMKTEHLRLKSLSEKGAFIPPVPFEMGYEEVYEKQADGIVRLIQRPVFGQFIPLGRVLKSFLELPGVFEGIENYIQELDLNDNVVKNIVQGNLWRDVKDFYVREGKMVLPVNLEFDDVVI